MLQVNTFSAAETFEFGRRLAAYLRAGDIVCLTGTLGAGKTALAQGIVAGLGTVDTAVSPTFTILNVYQGAIPVYHFDLYRLDEPEQLQDIGFEEYTEADGVALIEWADKFERQLPSEHLWIDISPSGLNSRLIRIKAAGNRYEQIIKELT